MPACSVPMMKGMDDAPDAGNDTDELERLASELESLLRNFRADPSNSCRTGCRRCPFGYRREWALQPGSRPV
jgi:hypothetical protein